jgi:hypothetical protein
MTVLNKTLIILLIYDQEKTDDKKVFLADIVPSFFPSTDLPRQIHCVPFKQQ